jgi:hypothetical protein
MTGENPVKKMPFVYSIIWFISKNGLTETVIKKLKFIDIFKKQLFFVGFILKEQVIFTSVRVRLKTKEVM